METVCTKSPLGEQMADSATSEVLNDNCGHYTVTIPSDIAPGQYLLRAETIALHTASQPGGAQFYMSCYQVEITGGGSAKPPTVKIPGAYSASDPGILVDIHKELDTYVGAFAAFAYLPFRLDTPPLSLPLSPLPLPHALPWARFFVRCLLGSLWRRP